MAQIIVNRYATALFEIAKEKGAMKDYKEEAQMVKDILFGEPDYMKLLTHPSILEEEKLEFVDKAFTGHVSDELVGLMCLVIKKTRQEYLVDILDAFIEMAKQEEGLLNATVTSAVSLTNQQLAQIKSQIEQKTGKVIELHTVVDASLIGGLVVRVGDQVVDGSIKGQMDTLKSQLNSLRLA